MGYAWESRLGMVTHDTALNAAIAMQSPADKGALTCTGPVTALRLCVLVTTAVTGTAAVLALDRRVTYGSDTGRVEIGRITLPVGTAIGKVVWKELEPMDLDMGDQMVWELITASTAGGGVLSVEYIPRAEMPSNQPDAIKSA